MIGIKFSDKINDFIDNTINNLLIFGIEFLINEDSVWLSAMGTEKFRH